MEKIHETLYWSKEVKVAEYPDTLDVQLRGIINGTPDCKIGHFGYNFYFRTPYGVLGKPYKSEKTMMRSIKKAVKKYGLTFEAFIDKK